MKNIYFLRIYLILKLFYSNSHEIFFVISYKLAIRFHVSKLEIFDLSIWFPSNKSLAQINDSFCFPSDLFS